MLIAKQENSIVFVECGKQYDAVYALTTQGMDLFKLW